ncbi:MAG: TonB-dependent receptor [Pseudomonadota bacterium]
MNRALRSTTPWSAPLPARSPTPLLNHLLTRAPTRLPTPVLKHLLTRWLIPLFLLVFAAVLMPQAQAQDSSKQTYRFDIEAQPLLQALEAFSDVTRRQVGADAEAIDRLSSNAISGELTAQSALERMIAGTGLELVTVNGSSFALRAPQGGTPETRSIVSPPSTAIEEVLVIGQLQERLLQDTQASVTVFTGEALDKGTDRNLFDVIDRTANASQLSAGLGISIRGISQLSFGTTAAGDAVSIRVDGATLPSGSFTGSFGVWDLQQVEVLRGPQSTQQGRNSLAGAVVIRSQDPTFERELKARGDVGSFDELRLAGALNLPLIEDTLAMRLSYEAYRSDGEVRNRFTGEFQSDEELNTGRAKLRWQATDRLNIILSHSETENDYGRSIVNPQFYPVERVTNNLAETRADESISNLRFNFDLSPDWLLFSETVYYDRERPNFSSFPPESGEQQVFDSLIETTQLSQEIRLSYASEALRTVLGAFYTDIDEDSVTVLALGPNNSLLPLPPGIESVINDIFAISNNENLAFYGELEYDLSDRFTVLGSLRYDREDSESLSENALVFVPAPPFPLPPSEPIELSTSFDAWLPKGGIVYRWTEDVSTGLTYHRGYRAGGAGQNALGSVFEFDPEFTDNLELSFRSLLLNGSLVLNANLFYTEYTDIQIRVPGDSGNDLDVIIDNAGEATLYGGELELQWQARNDLSAFASLGYTKTEFDEYVTPDNVDVSGNQFPEAPELTWAVGGTWLFLDAFDLNMNVNYTDETFFSAVNLPTEISDSYTLVNAQLTYRSDRWSVGVYARNLLDEEYVTRRRDGAMQGWAVGDSRVVGVTVTGGF